MRRGRLVDDGLWWQRPGVHRRRFEVKLLVLGGAVVIVSFSPAHVRPGNKSVRRWTVRRWTRAVRHVANVAGDTGEVRVGGRAVGAW